jgi:hypothetical protein
MAAVGKSLGRPESFRIGRARVRGGDSAVADPPSAGLMNAAISRPRNFSTGFLTSPEPRSAPVGVMARCV